MAEFVRILEIRLEEKKKAETFNFGLDLLGCGGMQPAVLAAVERGRTLVHQRFSGLSSRALLI